MGPPSLLLLLFLGATVAPAAPPDLEELEDYAECSDGYEWDPETEHCKDVDECAGPPPCRPSQDCINLPGGFECRCPPGYRHRDTECVDVDECSMGARCSQRCLNTFGSFRCRCRPGFVLGADGHECHDVDECRGGVPCQHRCQNLPGGFSCLCPPGYAEEGGLCRDLDECTEGSHDCGGAQSCLNTFGGHLCVPRELCRGPYTPHPRSNGTP
ncbi:hypothetical protein TURU_005385 [Turdus rufiventris]|nr:hypothetical protein TURU_005385 [Turdus rufiventris]